MEWSGEKILERTFIFHFLYGLIFLPPQQAVQEYDLNFYIKREFHHYGKKSPRIY